MLNGHAVLERWLHGLCLTLFPARCIRNGSLGHFRHWTEAEVDSQTSRSSAIMLLLLGGFHAATDCPGVATYLQYLGRSHAVAGLGLKRAVIKGMHLGYAVVCFNVGQTCLQ